MLCARSPGPSVPSIGQGTSLIQSASVSLSFFFKLKVSSDSLENIVIFLRKCDHVAVPVEGHLCADACAPGCSAKERAMVQASLPEQAHVASGPRPRSASPPPPVTQAPRDPQFRRF